MTAKAAFNEAIKTFKVSMGEEGQYFTSLYWKSPESGQIIGPFLVTMADNVVIQVSEAGVFHSVFSGRSNHYYPYYAKSVSSERPGL